MKVRLLYIGCDEKPKETDVTYNKPDESEITHDEKPNEKNVSRDKKQFKMRKVSITIKLKKQMI